MTTRILPRDEWDRLSGTELGEAIDALRACDADVIVVEDAGRVVGCWSVIRYVHLEGVWVAPEYRRQGSVIRRLLRGAFGRLRELGVTRAWSAAMAPEIEDLLRRIGGVPLPEAKHFVIGV